MFKHLTGAAAVILTALLLCTWTASGFVAAAPAKKGDPRAAARKAAEKDSKRIVKATGKRIRSAAKSAAKEIRRITKIVKKGKGYDKLGPDVPVFAKGGNGDEAPTEVLYYAWTLVCAGKDGYGSLALQYFDEANEQACDSAPIATYLNLTQTEAHTTAFAYDFSAELYKTYFDGYCDVQSACGDAFEEISAQGGYCTQASQPLAPPRSFFTSSCGSPRRQQLADVCTFTATFGNGTSRVITRCSGTGVQAFDDSGYDYRLEVRCRNADGDLVYVSPMQPDASGYYYLSLGDVDASRGGGVFAARSYAACPEYDAYGLDYYDDNDEDDDDGGRFHADDDDDDDFDNYERSSALSCYYPGYPETELPDDCVAANQTITEIEQDLSDLGGSPLRAFARLLVDVLTDPSPQDVDPNVPVDQCDASKYTYFRISPTPAAKPGPAAVLGETRFPRGAGPVGFTVFPDTETSPPAGDVLVISVVYQADIPLNDPTNLYQYGFVFDQDGNTGNNFVPLPQFANDFFQNTDKWYEVLYTPQAGWSLKVTDARNGGFVQVASAARAVINGNSITLAVPAAEFGVPRPSFRFSAFRHTGDFGLNPPHDFSADYFPDPKAPLQPFDR